jgi:hypothetical protein
MRLKNRVTCRLLRQPSAAVRQLLEYVSLDRAGEEVGPVDYQGEVLPRHQYAIEYSVPNSVLTLVPYHSDRHRARWQARRPSPKKIQPVLHPVTLRGV